MTGRPAILISLTFLALALAPLLTGMGAATTLPILGTVPDVVAGKVVLEDGTFTISKPLAIPAGATLIIRNAVVYLDAPSECNIEAQGLVGCRGAIQIRGGNLIVRDSVIDSRLPLAAKPSKGEISGHAGFFDIQGSTLSNLSRVFLQEGSPIPSVFRGNTVRDGTSGVVLWRGTVGTVENNRFENLASYGVHFQDATGVIRGNTFVNVNKRVIHVQASVVGEKAWETAPLVEGNVIDGGFVGITYHTGVGGIIRDNTVRNTNAGLAVGITYGPAILHSVAADVYGNVIENTKTAVTVYGALSSGVVSSPMDTALTIDLTGNSFIGSACHDVSAIAPRTSTLTVDATGNWWGSADGPQDHGAGCPAVAISGAATVATAPWLTSAPS